MARHLIVMLALILLVATESANATLESFDFTDSVSEQRFRGLIEELRCLVCQNESLLASQADLARDLREEVYTMMAEGKTDAEVITFLVDR
ncbi:MAG: cytochrome c-type biogenesis protein CcmH, partial [Gammaproteobacteria bacterium]|nr:cytochrome c-type biogenesis protein CcmH [Gammaproteobacteria bacterium]